MLVSTDVTAQFHPPTVNMQQLPKLRSASALDKVLELQINLRAVSLNCQPLTEMLLNQLSTAIFFPRTKKSFPFYNIYCIFNSRLMISLPRNAYASENKPALPFLLENLSWAGRSAQNGTLSWLRHQGEPFTWSSAQAQGLWAVLLLLSPNPPLWGATWISAGEVREAHPSN